MTSAYALTSRLIEHRIELLLTAAMLDQLPGQHERVARLAAGALALVQQHTIDEQGRCQICTDRGRWRRRRVRPCTVHAAFSAYLMPPDAAVHRQITELLH